MCEQWGSAAETFLDTLMCWHILFTEIENYQSSQLKSSTLFSSQLKTLLTS